MLNIDWGASAMHHTADMFFDSNRRTKCMKQIVNNFPKSVEKFGGIVE